MAPLVIRRSGLPDQYSSLITVIHGTFADWSHQPPPQLTLPRREMNTCWYLAACLDIVLGLSVVQTTCPDIGTETNQRVLDHTLVTKNEPSLLLPHHGPPVRQLTLSTAMQIYGHQNPLWKGRNRTCPLHIRHLRLMSIYVPPRANFPRPAQLPRLSQHQLPLPTFKVSLPLPCEHTRRKLRRIYSHIPWPQGFKDATPLRPL